VDLIRDVVVRPLRLIPDDRGFLMEMLRRDWPEFREFGQAYITTCYPGVVKAWHFHKHQWDYFVCVHGMAKVVLYDPRDGSPTQGVANEFHMGALNPMLLSIPPLVYHGFAAEGPDVVVMVNIPTNTYNYAAPDEYRLPYDDPRIPYDWRVKSR
jgi:dTDP-4-dehydrorhamnose 3,5-epimerase